MVKTPMMFPHKLSAVLLVLLLVLSWGIASANLPETPELMKKGETLFKRECTVCHGEKGFGDGTAAYLLFPKPRDLTMGVFKIRSTPTGEPPTDEDLFRTISEGLPGSAMPSFRSLSEEDRWSLVYYVKMLADLSEPPERVIEVLQESPVTTSTLMDGKELYEKLKCWECHGHEGKGDGPAASTAKDDMGYPAPPNDFTRGIYKGGGRGSDIYLRFTTGVDGTPMPSYEDSIAENERWALVQYVKSLAGPKIAVQPGGGYIVVKRLAADIKLDPLDSLWDKIPAHEIPLMLLWQRQQAVETASVKAVHNGKNIAFLIEWKDLSPQARFTRHQDFTDSVAFQFPVSFKDVSLFTMGESAKPVNIWYWRADRQMDLKKFQDIEDLYGDMISDDYQFAGGYYPKDIEKTTVEWVGAVLEHDPDFITGWGLNNLLSLPKRLSAVEDLNAEGFGTVTAQSADGQNVSGQGVWALGKWKVILLRTLESEEEFDVKFTPGEENRIGLAVWDGSQGDRDGQKSVTPWYNLKIEK